MNERQVRLRHVRTVIREQHNRPIQTAFCDVCGEVLTSERSIQRGRGQRCHWKIYGRRKRTSGVSQGAPIGDAKFSFSGGKGYQRARFEEL